MKWIFAASALGLLVAGCATPQDLERKGYEDLAEAQYYEQVGDYRAAARHRAEAQHHFQEAYERGYYYGYYGYGNPYHHM